MKRWLFLDDDDNRHNHFKTLIQALPDDLRPTVRYVKTAAEAIFCLTCHKFDTVWLDHDLDMTDPHETGQVVAEYISYHQYRLLNPKTVIIHSHNPDGAKRMKSILEEQGIPVKLQKFTFP